MALNFPGMFMVCVEFMGKSGRLLANSCRSTMLHYRGILIDTLYKLFYSPFYIIFGTSEEKQNVHVELFSDYEEQEVDIHFSFYVQLINLEYIYVAVACTGICMITEQKFHKNNREY